MHQPETMAACHMRELLQPDDVALEMATIPEWSESSSVISRTFRFEAYLDGIAFVNEVAKLADAVNHHPDICIGWRKVVVQISTHSKGGLTELDFALAREIDSLVPRP